MTSLEDVIRRAMPDASDVHVRAARSAYSTSFPIDDVEVDLPDGRCLRLMLKDLHWDALIGDARTAKPRWLYDPARETGVYRVMLPQGPAGPPVLVAASTGDDTDGFLLLEKVAGRELFQCGDIEDWQAAARWFRSLHDTFAGRAADVASHGAVPLLMHDANWYADWLRRALTFVSDPRLQWIAARYGDVVDRLVAQPRTFIHGEAYASNVLVAAGRIAAIDWEMAAVGPAFVDLAALTTGKGWLDGDRLAITRAYLGHEPAAQELADLDACRLSLAVQWLGWANGWTPPSEHAHDWLTEAVDVCERLT